MTSSFSIKSILCLLIPTFSIPSDYRHFDIYQANTARLRSQSLEASERVQIAQRSMLHHEQKAHLQHCLATNNQFDRDIRSSPISIHANTPIQNIYSGLSTPSSQNPLINQFDSGPHAHQIDDRTHLVYSSSSIPLNRNQNYFPSPANKQQTSLQEELQSIALSKAEKTQMAQFSNQQWKAFFDYRQIQNPLNFYALYSLPNFREYIKTVSGYRQAVIDLSQKYTTDNEFQKQLDNCGKWVQQSKTDWSSWSDYLKFESKSAKDYFIQKKVGQERERINNVTSKEFISSTARTIEVLYTTVSQDIKRTTEYINALHQQNKNIPVEQLNAQLESQKRFQAFLHHLKRINSLKRNEQATSSSNVLIFQMGRYATYFPTLNTGLTFNSFDMLACNLVQKSIHECSQKMLLDSVALCYSAEKLGKESSGDIKTLTRQTIQLLHTAHNNNVAGNIEKALEELARAQDAFYYSQYLNKSNSPATASLLSLENLNSDQIAQLSKSLDPITHIEINNRGCSKQCVQTCDNQIKHVLQRSNYDHSIRLVERQSALAQLRTGNYGLKTQQYELTPEAKEVLSQTGISSTIFEQRTGTILEQIAQKQIVDLVNRSAQLYSSAENQTIQKTAQVSLGLADASLNQSLIGNHEFAFSLADLGHKIVDAAINCNPMPINQWQLRQIKKMTTMAVGNVWHMVSNPKEAAGDIIKGAAGVAHFTSVFDGEALEYMTKEEHAAQVEMIVGALRKNGEEIQKMPLDDIITHAGAFVIEGIILEGIFKCFASAAKLSALKIPKYVAGMNAATKDLAMVKSFQEKLAPAFDFLESAIAEKINFFKGSRTAEEVAIAGTEIKVPVKAAEFVEKMHLPKITKAAPNDTLKLRRINDLRPTQCVNSIDELLPLNGTLVNGRKFTRHACERMAPRTPEVLAELERRAIELGVKKADWGTFIDPRNIPISVIEDVIANGIRTPARDGKWQCLGKEIKVYINEFGDVVSVHPF